MKFAATIQRSTSVRQYSYVWLKADIHQISLFHCWRCQCPLFRFQGMVALLMPGSPEDVPMQMPLELVCRNPHCPAAYIIEGFTN